MRSGKSDIAINQIQAYNNFGLRTAIFQPEKNTRDVFNGRPIWRSLSGGVVKKYINAGWYNSGDEILKRANDFDVFGFEEHHWYPEDYFFIVNKLDQMGKIVLSVGLDYFHNGQPVENFWNLKQQNNVRSIEGVSAFCEVDLEKGKYSLAERTQLLVNGKPAFFDTPTDLPESETVNYTYFPVSLKNWNVLPPKDPSLMHLYKRYYLDVKS